MTSINDIMEPHRQHFSALSDDDLLAGRQIADAAQLYERSRYERGKPNIDDQSAGFARPQRCQIIARFPTGS